MDGVSTEDLMNLLAEVDDMAIRFIYPAICKVAEELDAEIKDLNSQQSA